MKPVLAPWCKTPYTVPMRFKVFAGGRGSGKSYSVALMILMLCSRKKLRVLCTREIQVSIKASVYQLLRDLIIQYGWLPDWYITGQSMYHKTTGSYISFAGLKNNPESVKSTEGLDLVWVEEAQTISELSMRLLIPTVRKHGSEIWMTMNPRFESDYVYARFVKAGTTQSNVMLLHVNFDQNPWFPEVLRSEMEYDKESNHGLYLHTWLGQLRPYGERPAFGDGLLVWDGIDGGEPDIYGMDLSYSGNNVLVGASVRANGRELVIESARGATGIPLQKLGNWVGEVHKTIVVDSARPEVIRLLKDEHFSVRKAEKGAGSVLGGIDRLNRFKSIVFKNGTEAAYDEFSKLGFNDKEELIGTRDYCDATRYAVEKISPFKVISWDKLSRRGAS